MAAKIPGVGSLFAQPVYVTNWPIGGLGGGAAGGGGGGTVGGLGVKAGLAAVGITAASMTVLAGGIAAAVMGGTMMSEAIDRHRREDPNYQIPRLMPGGGGKGGPGGDARTAAQVLAGYLRTHPESRGPAPSVRSPDADERSAAAITGRAIANALDHARGERGLAPTVNVKVNVSVTERAIRRSSSTQVRYGPSAGSAFQHDMKGGK